MAFDEGFDFRKNQDTGFPALVDSPSRVVNSFGSGSDYYPKSGGSFNYGWVLQAFDIDGRDRNLITDVRLAGAATGGTHGTPYKFKVDLPNAGIYRIWLAIGDYSYSQSNLAWDILDNTTSLDPHTGLSTSADTNWLDATAVERTSAADWVSNNAYIEKTFATTTFFLTIGDGTNAGWVAHLRILDVTPAAAPVFQPPVVGARSAVIGSSVF